MERSFFGGIFLYEVKKKKKKGKQGGIGAVIVLAHRTLLRLSVVKQTSCGHQMRSTSKDEINVPIALSAFSFRDK